jgi:predicted helicase
LSEWHHAFITTDIADNCSISNKTKERGYLFPLYLYPSETKKKISLQSMMVFDPEVSYGKDKKKPNIAPKIFEQLEKAYKKKPSPEQILYYVYAVLSSNLYREKYAEFLKIDFPRIPFTSNYELFLEAAKLGEELAEHHLLKHKALNKPVVKYFGKGDSDKIERPVYNPDEERVYINEQRYFENITAAVWKYQIGGYQVMEKYLKDRKGREMDDPGHYCKMATTIAKTMDVQKEMDRLFLEIEKQVIV